MRMLAIKVHEEVQQWWCSAEKYVRQRGEEVVSCGRQRRMGDGIYLIVDELLQIILQSNEKFTPNRQTLED